MVGTVILPAAMSRVSHQILIVFIFSVKSYEFSSHWNRVLPRVCSDTTPDNVFNALIDCDQHMDREAKQIFDDCVYEVTGNEVNDNKPRICYYRRNAQRLDACKSQRYKQKNYDIKQIINKELKHMWCLMKVARPLGWEHLCVSNLSATKKSAVRRCDDTFREITNPITQCYSQVIGQRSDGRPMACRSFENPIELWECLERRSKQRNRGSDLETKANRYMDCLKSI